VASIVVGLGNPGPEYQGTRHNVGHRVLDHLARTALRRSKWRREASAMLYASEWRGTSIKLLKPVAFMNESGPVVARALRRHHAGPADLVLVYDDIDLPLGTVRVRMKGSSGGHKGVRSVIEAFGTEDIRRVKIGVGRPEHKHDVPDHVLTTFSPDELPQVEAAVSAAAERVLALIAG
jgi:peptidyl-tRNA hydrolase, PTH1 family